MKILSLLKHEIWQQVKYQSVHAESESLNQSVQAESESLNQSVHAESESLYQRVYAESESLNQSVLCSLIKIFTVSECFHMTEPKLEQINRSSCAASSFICIVTSRKHAYIIFTPLNPTFI